MDRQPLERDRDMDRQPLPGQILFDTPMAAALLSLSADMLERYRSEGGGPKYLKIRGRGRTGWNVRYTREALVAWVGTQTEVSNTADAAMKAS